MADVVRSCVPVMKFSSAVFISPYGIEPVPVVYSEKSKENKINYEIVKVNEQYFVWEAERSCETIICG